MRRKQEPFEPFQSGYDKTANRIIIKTKLMDLNKYTNLNRTNQYAGASVKKKLTDYIMAECLSQRLKLDLDRSATYDLKIYWIVPDKRKDADNVYSQVKFMLDGIVKANIIDGDGRKSIRNITNYIRTVKGKEFVIVRLHALQHKNNQSR